MALFLQIIGGIFVVIIGLIAAIFIFFKLKFGKYMNANTDQPPLHIHLNEDISPDWLNKPAAKKVSEELTDAGFVAGKPYLIHEMEGYLLQAFFKKPAVAVMYWHDVAGCWVDVSVEEVDGKEYTASNAPMFAETPRTECEKKVDKDASVADLCKDMDSIISSSEKDFVECNEENFREYFETAFKKDITWKNRNGGVSYAEFKSIENDAPFNVKESVSDEAFVEVKEAELYQWHDAALEEYKSIEGIKDDDFYDIAEKLIIVPFTTNATAFIRYLSNNYFVDEKQEESLIKVFAEESNIDILFNKMNDLLSPDLRASFVMDVEYPLPIRIYKLCDKMVDY